MVRKTNNIIEDLLKKISKQHDELDTLRGEYMAECKGPRGRIRDLMGTAKENDLDMPAFRELVREHLDERKKQRRLAELEGDTRAALDDMIAALGPFADTELGAAAVRRVQDEDTLDTLHQ